MARQRKTQAGEQAGPMVPSWDGADLPSAPFGADLQRASFGATPAALALVPSRHNIQPQQPTPGGMVRISKADQHRCIWPVHLGGWQQLGWSLLATQGAELQSAELQSAELQAAGPQTAGPRAAGRRNSKPVLDPPTPTTTADEPEQATETLSASALLHPIHPLDSAQDLESLTWDETTAEQP